MPHRAADPAERHGPRPAARRATPDSVYVCPPLIITKGEIDELMDALKGALDDGYAEAVRKGLVGAEVKKAG